MLKDEKLSCCLASLFLVPLVKLQSYGGVEIGSSLLNVDQGSF